MAKETQELPDRRATRDTLPARFCAAAVLAGGASERMAGTDKQFLDAGGEPLVFRILSRLGRVFPELIVATRYPERYEPLACTVKPVRDKVPGFGPLSGLHAVLTEARGEWVYLAACDTPEFDMRWVRLLAEEILAAERAGKAPLAANAGYRNHLEPFHAFYSTRLVPGIERAFRAAEAPFRSKSIGALLSGVPSVRVSEDRVRELYPDWGLFRNINTPADWDAFKAGQAW